MQDVRSRHSHTGRPGLIWGEPRGSDTCPPGWVKSSCKSERRSTSRSRACSSDWKLPAEITQSNISAYERGTREAPVFVIVRYAEIANVWVDVLVKDSLDLPVSLPSLRKHEGIQRKKK